MLGKRRGLVLASALCALALVFFLAAPAAKRKAESVSCGKYMESIGYAALLWADDHDGRLPSDLLSMSNELNTPKILFCPGDHLRKPVSNWASFNPADSRYEIVTPGLRKGDANGVFLRCRIHGHLGYANGTVCDGSRRRTKLP